MAKELRELSRVIEKAEEDKGNEEIGTALREAAYQIQARQFLYRSKGRHRRHYELIVQHQDYFVSLLDAMNYTLEINEDRGYVGILPRSFARRMSLNSTLLLFALRFIYDQELMAFNADDDGTVQVTLEDFETRSRQFAKRDVARSSGDLKSLLEPFTQVGVVEIGPDEQRPEIERIKIYPSIATLLSGNMLQRVEVYMRAEDIETHQQDADDSTNENEGAA